MDRRPSHETVMFLHVPQSAQQPRLRASHGIVALVSALVVGLAGRIVPDLSMLALLLMAGSLLALHAFALGHLHPRHLRAANSTVDALTGLPDAAAFRAFVHIELAHPDAKLGVLYIEMRNVSLLRSTFGREAVETVYQMVGARLRADIRSHDSLAHFGEGLFVLALKGVGNRADLEVIAARHRSELGRPLLVGGTRLRPTWSAAAVLAPADADNADDLLLAADAARDHAHPDGNQPLRWLPPSSRIDLASQRSRQRELLEAIDTGAFFPVFQPQLDLHAGRIDRVEVLMRWRRSDGRVAGPNEFLDEVRVLGALPTVSRDVYATALRRAKEWRRKGLDLKHIALNLDATQVAGPNWEQDLLHLIDASGLRPIDVEIEISENILASVDLGLLVDGLRTLRQGGTMVSLDDFGTGFASMTQLASLPIDLVKLDARLLWDMMTKRRVEIVVEGIVHLVDRLGLPCLFEGIETPEHLAKARALGGSIGQGFLIGRPQPADELERLLRPVADVPITGVDLAVAGL